MLLEPVSCLFYGLKEVPSRMECFTSSENILYLEELPTKTKGLSQRKLPHNILLHPEEYITYLLFECLVLARIS